MCGESVSGITELLIFLIGICSIGIIFLPNRFKKLFLTLFTIFSLVCFFLKGQIVLSLGLIILYFLNFFLEAPISKLQEKLSDITNTHIKLIYFLVSIILISVSFLIINNPIQSLSENTAHTEAILILFLVYFTIPRRSHV